MESVEGGENLQTTLPEEMYEILDLCINEERRKIDEIAENFIEQAKKYGPDLEVTFGELPKVKFLKETLQFFDKECQLNSIKDDIRNFDKFIADTQKKANVFTQVKQT